MNGDSSSCEVCGGFASKYVPLWVVRAEQPRTWVDIPIAPLVPPVVPSWYLERSYNTLVPGAGGIRFWEMDGIGGRGNGGVQRMGRLGLGLGGGKALDRFHVTNTPPTGRRPIRSKDAKVGRELGSLLQMHGTCAHLN